MSELKKEWYVVNTVSGYEYKVKEKRAEDKKKTEEKKKPRRRKSVKAEDLEKIIKSEKWQIML